MLCTFFWLEIDVELEVSRYAVRLVGDGDKGRRA
jgi:hypothetical protein